VETEEYRAVEKRPESFQGRRHPARYAIWSALGTFIRTGWFYSFPRRRRTASSQGRPEAVRLERRDQSKLAFNCAGETLLLNQRNGSFSLDRRRTHLLPASGKKRGDDAPLRPLLRHRPQYRTKGLAKFRRHCRRRAGVLSGSAPKCKDL